MPARPSEVTHSHQLEATRQFGAIGGAETRLGANGVDLLVDGGERGVEIDVEIAARSLRVGERSPSAVAQSRVAARRAAICADGETATLPHADPPENLANPLTRDPLRRTS